MSEIKLLSCPFCGGEAALARDRSGLWRVGCKKCKCMTTYQFDFGEGEEVSKNKAVNVWNARKPMERIVKQLESKIIRIGEEDEMCSNGDADIEIEALEYAIEIVQKGGAE